MPISIFPNQNVQGVVGVPVCFQATANVVIPQEDRRYIDLPPSGTNWTYTLTGADAIWSKVSGVNHNWDAEAIAATSINALQPFDISAINGSFTTPAAPNRFYACQWGVLDDANNFYGWYLWKNCGNQGPPCGGPNTDNSKWEARFIVGSQVIFFRTVNFFEEFRLRSDGFNLHWDWKTASFTQTPCTPGPVGPCWRLSQFTWPLPQTSVFRYRLASAYISNKVHGVTTFKGSFVGQVPTIWTAPLGGTILGEGNNRCFVAGIAGSYQTCVESEFDPPTCVPIEIDNLYLRPIGLECNECVFTNQVVQFESNGGLSGELTADAGTVIDSLTWQAPSTPINFVTLTYSIGGFFATCRIVVIRPLELLNVDGQEIKGLIPGQTFKILTNYDFDPEADVSPEVEWINVTCQNIVQPDGTVHIPKASPHNCFGALDCTIRVILKSIGETPTCENLTDDSVFIDVRLLADPVYPTPDLGGPLYVKWKPETPDYRVIINEFDGGCDETHIRNKVPIQRWMVRYDGLPYDDACTPEPCCGEFDVPGGANAPHQSVTRLDEFWNLVYGQYGYFTLIEPRTGRVWRRVRFEGEMERDHINWRYIQSRDFTLVWRPCCDEEPQGGTCPHVTLIDTVFPQPPQNLSILPKKVDNPNQIHLVWQKATDNVGIKGYEIEIDGFIIDLGHVLTYVHKNVQPNSSHTYRVRAYDFAGNKSEWTPPVIGSNVVNVVEGSDNVIDGTDNVIEG